MAFQLTNPISDEVDDIETMCNFLQSYKEHPMLIPSVEFIKSQNSFRDKESTIPINPMIGFVSYLINYSSNNLDILKSLSKNIEAVPQFTRAMKLSSLVGMQRLFLMLEYLVNFPLKSESVEEKMRVFKEVSLESLTFDFAWTHYHLIPLFIKKLNNQEQVANFLKKMQKTLHSRDLNFLDEGYLKLIYYCLYFPEDFIVTLGRKWHNIYWERPLTEDGNADDCIRYLQQAEKELGIEVNSDKLNEIHMIFKEYDQKFEAMISQEETLTNPLEVSSIGFAVAE